MCINEIKSSEEAQDRLRRFFVNEHSMDENTVAQNMKSYVTMLELLCNLNGKSFRDALEFVSIHTWLAYNTENIKKLRNRFTRSILKCGIDHGFACQSNVVFVGPLDAEAFGARVRNKVLWKDSFANDHGEFSHSYQWLAASYVLVGLDPADLYGKTAGVMSRVPLFKVSNGRLIFAQAPLWEWLVDCTLYQSKFEGQKEKAVNDYFDAQKEKFVTGAPTNVYFIKHYVKKYFADTFCVDGDPKGKLKKDYAKDRRRANSEAIRRLLATQEPGRKKAFVAAQILHFPEQNALTLAHAAGGSFRSANNVTTEVRLQRDWFICCYEMHRTGTEAMFAGGEFMGLEKEGTEGKMRRATRVGQKTLADHHLANSDVSAKQAERLKRGRTPGNRERSEFQRTVTYGNLPQRQAVLKTALPLEAIKGERIAHYDGQEKRGLGWQAADNYVFEKPLKTQEKAAEEEAANKGQLETIYFHGFPGTLNATVGGVNIEK